MQADPITTESMRAVAVPDASQVGWFAARQPGIIYYLESRCGGPTDAFAVALEASWRLCLVFEAKTGVPPARVPRALLARWEAVLCGTKSVGRQPELMTWVAELAAAPPLPLNAAERQAVAAGLSAVLCALDELTAGR